MKCKLADLLVVFSFLNQKFLFAVLRLSKISFVGCWEPFSFD